MSDENQLEVAIECIQSNLRLISEGKVEDVIRHNFTSYLRTIFPDLPSWVERHIEGGEAAVKYSKTGKIRTGFVDNLVDLTAIEYESNLTVKPKFDTGFGQVKDYCASLLNKGHDPELVIGVLSDTIRWRAYKIKSVSPPSLGKLGGEHLELEEIEQIDLSDADENAAKKLIGFLNTHLGRLGSRPLNAESISKDLGFESRFCGLHISHLRDIVSNAFASRPKYASLITNLWGRFVSYVTSNPSINGFDQSSYSDEFYILTVAKLVCANVIERKALISDDNELRSILKGDFFKNKGLINLVEYDYFGWLNEGESLEELLPVAHALQDDLRAYDFTQSPVEDLFGQMMAQLAKRSQRLLLGQEWTPNWLAHLIVEKVISDLPHTDELKLVDMCCGSGAIIVEAVKLAKERISMTVSESSSDQRLNLLSQAITGFDIDPLAVMLSKISWVLAAGSWLEPHGAYPVTIPVFHADSLFAITPLSLLDDKEIQEFYSLKIAEDEIQLPCFLISPAFQTAFDSILDFGYNLAIYTGPGELQIDETALNEAITYALSRVATEVQPDQFEKTKKFLIEFVTVVDKLNRDGRNGIWAFILRNSYRPGLVAGQFNGLVSNPPWLALSKIGDNPYQGVLRRKAEQFGIKPAGPSFLHIEMATIFLLHAIDRYLQDGSVIGCITPETVLNGYHHAPFRNAAYNHTDRPVNLSLNEIWRVKEQTFKNKAIVLFGEKEAGISKGVSSTIPGGLAGPSGVTPFTFHRITQGERTAWSENPSTSGKGFFSPANFHQGADIMPRTLFFHELKPVPPIGGKRQWNVSPIDIGTSAIAFMIKDASKLKEFKLNPCVLPDDLMFDVATSNLLTPFEIAPPVKALLPIRKQPGGTWGKLSQSAIAAKGHSAVSAFTQIAGAIDPGSNLDSIWKAINTRNKLSRQVIQPGGFIVFTGTSGQNVCSAFLDASRVNLDKLIIDQTLNWARVETLDEAIYLVGLFNSEAINLVIQDFQPEGEFGKRHIHSLPFGVTPPFDSGQAAHQQVVEATKKLMNEYNALKVNDQDLVNNLHPNKSTLARRRRIIRLKINKLLSYEEYKNACHSLYGV